MALPGYVVPGQIISPIVEKDANGIIRFFEAGKGVTVDTVHGVQLLSATIVGKTVLSSLDGKAEDADMETDSGDAEPLNLTLKFKVSVENNLSNSYAIHGIHSSISNQRSNNSALPEDGDIVLARVTRLTLSQANVKILAIENSSVVSADGGNGVNAPGESKAVNSSGNVNTGATATEIGEGFGGIIRVQDVRATERDKVKILDSFRPGDIVRAAVISLGDGTNYYLSTAHNELGVIFAVSRSGGQMIPIDWQSMQCTLTGVVEPRKCAKP